MNMDGTNGLACLTKVNRDGQATTVSPLPHMFVVRDLVVDMSNFYAQYKSIKPYLQTDSAHRCESLYTQSFVRSRLSNNLVWHVDQIVRLRC
jgi:succinate dehydrogenase (ubiquinone) iron-sulfur subunit